MKRSEFSDAVDAYLAGTANSWQEFIVEDHYDSHSNGDDILDLLREEQIKEIGDRVFAAIMKRIREMGEE